MEIIYEEKNVRAAMDEGKFRLEVRDSSDHLWREPYIITKWDYVDSTYFQIFLKIFSRVHFIIPEDFKICEKGNFFKKEYQLFLSFRKDFKGIRQWVEIDPMRRSGEDDKTKEFFYKVAVLNNFTYFRWSKRNNNCSYTTSGEGEDSEF